MSEEKKEEIKKEQAPAPQAEAAPAATPQTAAAPKAEAAPAANPQAAEKKEAPKKEKPSACIGCKKSIKKKRWYYRDGQYYCTKRCWSTTVKKAEKKDETPAAAA